MSVGDDTGVLTSVSAIEAFAQDRQGALAGRRIDLSDGRIDHPRLSRIDFSGAIFECNVVIERDHSGGFAKSIFKRPIVISGSLKSTSILNSAGADFQASLQLVNCHVRAIDFTGARFRSGVTFDNLRVERPLIMRECGFAGDVVFVRHCHLGTAKVVDSDSNTAPSADFSGSLFEQSLTFGEATAQYGVELEHCEFRGRIDSATASIRERISFDESEFTEDADLGTLNVDNLRVSARKCRFRGALSVESRTHSEELDFTGSTFEAAARFSVVVGRLLLDATRFPCDGSSLTLDAGHVTDTCAIRSLDVDRCIPVRLRGAFGTLDLSKSTFHGDVDLSGASVDATLRCDGTRFEAFCDLSSSRLTVVSELTGAVDLSGTGPISQNVEGVVFVGGDLSCATLHNCDIATWKFIGVEWAPMGRLQLGEATFRRIDSTKSEDRVKHLEATQESYQRLKRKFEDERNYKLACRFHYGEMQSRHRVEWMMREPARWMTTLYWLTSGYGERPEWAAGWLASVLVGFSIAYYYWVPFSNAADCSCAVTTPGDAFSFSLLTMALQKPERLVPAGWVGMVIRIVQMIVSVLLVGFFALALRRRYRR